MDPIELSDEEQAVFLANRGLAHAYVIRNQNPGESTDDLVQAAYLGLMKAIRAHDPVRGKLSTCAQWYMRQAVDRERASWKMITVPYYLRYTRHKQRTHTDAAEAALGASIVSIDFTFPAARVEDPESPVESHEQIEALRRAIDCLSPRSRFVVNARLDGRLLGDIGEIIGVTKERVRQMYEKAVRDLREIMNKAGAA